MPDDRICQRIRAVLCALLAALPALACQSRRIPLYQDPMEHQKVERPPLALYTVDWWTPLVLPSAWEYLPREPAAPAADADGSRIIVLTHDKMARAVSMACCTRSRRTPVNCCGATIWGSRWSRRRRLRWAKSSLPPKTTRSSRS